MRLVVMGRVWQGMLRAGRTPGSYRLQYNDRFQRNCDREVLLRHAAQNKPHGNDYSYGYRQQRERFNPYSNYRLDCYRQRAFSFAYGRHSRYHYGDHQVGKYDRGKPAPALFHRGIQYG